MRVHLCTHRLESTYIHNELFGRAYARQDGPYYDTIGDTSESELSSLMAPRGTIRTASLVDIQHPPVVVIILVRQVINLCPQTD